MEHATVHLLLIIAKLTKVINLAGNGHADAGVALEAVPRHDVVVKGQPTAEAVSVGAYNHWDLQHFLQRNIVQLTQANLRSRKRWKGGHGQSWRCWYLRKLFRLRIQI